MAEKDKKEISMLDLFRFEEGSDSELASKITSVNGSDIPFKEDEEESEETTDEVEDTDTEKEEDDDSTETKTETEGESDNEDSEDNDDSTNDSANTDDDDGGVYSAIVDDLAERGILIPKSDREYSEDDDGFADVVEDTVEHRVKEHINSLEELEIREGVTFKDFAEFIKEGGNPQDFVNHVTQVDYRKVVLTDEEDLEGSIQTQKLVIRDKLLLDDLSEEEIDETIEDLEKSNVLEKQAKLALKTLIKKQDEDYTRMLEANEEAKQTRIQELKQQEKALKDAVYSLKKIGNFELTETEQEKYYKYLTVPVKKDSNGNLLTQYQLDTLDLNKRLELGYIHYKGGIEGLEKKVVSKSNLKLKEKISRLNKEDKNNNKSTESFEEGRSSNSSTSKKQPNKLKISFPDWMN